MGAAELYTSQLLNACHVLFGREVDVSVQFLQYLQMPGLKAAFRKRALETHPDRAVSLALEVGDLEKQFKEVHAAYKDLSVFVENPLQVRLIDDCGVRGPGKYAARPYRNAGMRSGASTAGRDRGHMGSFSPKAMPRREFLFGRYLYYHNLISYKQLIDAIIWQKVQRPTIGDLALRWKWLYMRDIASILKNRRSGEKFGECAIRFNFLTPYEIKMLLGRQRLMQPRIGRYFVDNKILSPDIVEKMAQSLRLHNWQCRMTPRRSGENPF